MRYVLDTTLLIDIADGMPAARTVFGALFDEPNDLYTCDVITAEALSGGSDEQRREITGILNALEYVSTHPRCGSTRGGDAAAARPDQPSDAR